jgi:hypothetical protein
MTNFPSSPDDEEIFTNDIGVKYIYYLSEKKWRLVSNNLIAESVSLTDTGDIIEGTNVETALQELASKLNSGKIFVPFANDESDWDYSLITSTNDAYVDIDLVNGDVENATNMSTATSNNDNHKVPVGTRAVVIHGIFSSFTSIHTTNRITIWEKGNSNIYNTVFCYPPPVVNYFSSMEAIVYLDANSKCRFKFAIGAGGITSYWNVRGYYL